MVTEIKIPETLLKQLGENDLFPSDLVFYITSSCNLRCKHCYVGNDLLSQNQVFGLKDSVRFINKFPKLDRLTILGGEPFLYPQFDQLLNSLKINNISELRVTSNLTDISLYPAINGAVKRKLRICASLDGYNSEIHDQIRGRGAFEKTVRNLKLLVQDNIDLEITHTITSANISSFSAFIDLCEEIGVSKINLHRMSLHGNALNHRSLQVTPTQYVEFCSGLSKIRTKNGHISIRFPILFANELQYQKLIQTDSYKPHSFKSYYGDSQRIVVYPTRQVFISSEFFGTESHVGTFDDEKFYYNNSSANEIKFFKDPGSSISELNPNQTGDENYPFVLSVSFKETLTV
jgi:MoaA/NifB/PqqE/SkfB family radical SAM enzyme